MWHAVGGIWDSLSRGLARLPDQGGLTRTSGVVTLS